MKSKYQNNNLVYINIEVYNMIQNKMNEKHRRNKTMLQTKQSLKFQLKYYRSAENPEDYITNLLRKACLYNKVNTEIMNIEDLELIVKAIGLLLKNKQLHELYLYSTYEQQKGHRRPLSIVNLQKNKINILSISKWLQRKLLKNAIHIEEVEELKKTKKRLEKRVQTQSCQIKDQSETKLPQIKAKANNILTGELKNILGIFSEMEKERQYAGLQPMCISSDEEEEHGQPVKQIHYEGSFFEVNKKLFKMRDQARKGISKVIEATKKDKNLKKKFEEALMRYERIRTQANQKFGKCKAMKAQKRMGDKRKQQIQAIDLWRANTNQTELTSKFY